jgi:anti-sigma regulatory factor (Ser/Thr protein kinase)
MTTRPMDDATGGSGLRHSALTWRRGSGWADAVARFITDGVSRREPVSVGVSAMAAALLRERLDDAPLVDFFDMTRLGRNPGRIIGAMLDFAGRHAGRALRFVSEPFWAGRTDAESVEAARHEALVELALAEHGAAVLCLYDAGRLDDSVLRCAEATHRILIADGQSRASARYAGSGVLPEYCERPLPSPPATAVPLAYHKDLREVRMAVMSCADSAGLANGRAADLVLAASEVAANTLRHTTGGGTLLVWQTADEIICQITDTGWISDPLAGRRRPAADASGQGLWVVNQVCDLVELRSGAAGTTIRMHIRRN